MSRPKTCWNSFLQYFDHPQYEKLYFLSICSLKAAENSFSQYLTPSIWKFIPFDNFFASKLLKIPYYSILPSPPIWKFMLFDNFSGSKLLKICLYSIWTPSIWKIVIFDNFWGLKIAQNSFLQQVDSQKMKTWTFCKCLASKLLKIHFYSILIFLNEKASVHTSITRKTPPLFLENHKFWVKKT